MDLPENFDMRFNQWLDTFVQEKGLDLEWMFTPEQDLRHQLHSAWLCDRRHQVSQPG